MLTDEEITDELRLMTDHLTDELFAVPVAMAIVVRFPVSRLVVDPERFEADEEEPMVARGSLEGGATIGALIESDERYQDPAALVGMFAEVLDRLETSGLLPAPTIVALSRRLLAL